MTKEYVSTQRYKAFYWDGSNLYELREWFQKIGVAHNVELEDCGSTKGYYYIVKYNGERVGTLRPFAAWLVMSTKFHIPLELCDVGEFNERFKEVKE